MRIEAAPKLLDSTPQDARAIVLEAGAALLRGFASPHDQQLLAAVAAVVDAAPLRHMHTRSGWRMSVAMTNCGKVGWISDRKGYRYDGIDPDSGRNWPCMPSIFAELATSAAQAAGFAGFAADACLINCYRPGSRLTLHQDKNERAFDSPIVSVSLGLPAMFLWGGQKRIDRPRRIPLGHGDVVVWGGAARLNFHGVHLLAEGSHTLTGCARYNLTFRRAK